jgi:hypothetical protein
VITLKDVTSLIGEAHVCLTEAGGDCPEGLAAEYRRDALAFYAAAHDMLQGQPLEARHPVYGTGILVGVNQSGRALFHPDNADHPFEVDVFALREVL